MSRKINSTKDADKLFSVARKSDNESWFLSKETYPNFDGQWSDYFEPASVEDVAIHGDKKKELEALFHTISSKSGPRVVLLTGPPGCGKSTLAKLLSRQFRFDFTFYNPENSEHEDSCQEFREFLHAFTRYHLSLDVNQIPFILFDNFTELLQFNDELLNIIGDFSRTSSKAILCIVISRPVSNLVEIGFDLESKFLTRLVQSEIPVGKVEFNPVAQTFVQKALKRIILKVSKMWPQVRKPDAQLVKRIATECSGDIRTAVNQLQFFCLSNNIVSTSDFSHRDSGMSMFHALGKILYAKREGELEEQRYLQESTGRRVRCLNFSPEEVLDKSGLLGANVVSWLHENYLDFEPDPNDIEYQLEAKADAFSWADVNLTGCLNYHWKLGMSNASSDDIVSARGSAGRNYEAIFVARSLLYLSHGQNAPLSRRGFKALRPPAANYAAKSSRDFWQTFRLLISDAVDFGDLKFAVYQRKEIITDILGLSNYDPLAVTPWIAKLSNALGPLKGCSTKANSKYMKQRGAVTRFAAPEEQPVLCGATETFGSVADDVFDINESE